MTITISRAASNANTRISAHAVQLPLMPILPIVVMATVVLVLLVLLAVAPLPILLLLFPTAPLPTLVTPMGFIFPLRVIGGFGCPLAVLVIIRVIDPPLNFAACEQ